MLTNPSILRKLRPLLIVAATLGLLFATAQVADARRSVPVGLWGVENNPIKGGDDYLATRFVLDEPTTMYRFISGFNLEGVYTDEANQPAPSEIRTRYRDKRQVDGRYPPPPDDLPSGWSPGSGRWGYAHGNGGVIWARLVAVKADGRPDLSRVIAQEKVNAVKRYKESKAAYGTGLTQLLHFNFGGVRLEADTMYAVVFANADPDPMQNSFSTNLPATKQSVAGPNGTNTLDPDAPGAVAGLDPRETTTWTVDGGSSWRWGYQVGGGEDIFTYYAASPVSDGGPRMPWYGWQTSPSAAAAFQPALLRLRREGQLHPARPQRPPPHDHDRGRGLCPGGQRGGGGDGPKRHHRPERPHREPRRRPGQGPARQARDRRARAELRDLQLGHCGEGRSRLLCPGDVQRRSGRLALRDRRTRLRPRGALRDPASVFRGGG